MNRPKPKRKYASCGACRGKGLVWETYAGERLTQSAAMEMPKHFRSLQFCTCELGEAKRLAAAKEKR